MKIKVIKSASPKYWYADKIGQTFNACLASHYGPEDVSLWVLSDDITKTFVVEDVEIVLTPPYLYCSDNVE